MREPEGGGVRTQPCCYRLSPRCLGPLLAVAVGQQVGAGAVLPPLLFVT